MKEQASDLFPCMFSFIMFWCQWEDDYKDTAEMIFKKITSTKRENRFTSSEFYHHANKVSFHFGAANSTLRVSPWVPFLLCLAQSMYENVDDDGIKEGYLFKGGYFNGRAKSQKGKAKTEAPSDPPKQLNMFIYSKNIDKCPNTGVRLAFDNQIEQTLTTKRMAPYGDVDFPNNMVFTAFSLFHPANRNTIFPSSFRVQEQKLVTALNGSNMTIKDLLPIAEPEAEVDNNGDDDDDEDKPVPKAKVKHESVVQCLVRVAESYCEIENTIEGYADYATPNAVSNNENDEANSDNDNSSDNEDGRVNTTLKSLRDFRDELTEVLANSQEAFREFTTFLGLKHADSSRHFLLSRKCSEIKDVDGKPTATLIRGYLELAAKTDQIPRIIDTTPLNLNNLDKIVESFGINWDESFRSFTGNMHIDAEAIEKGICAVKFHQNRGVSLVDVIDAMEDGEANNVLNLYHAQLNWLSKGWTSNIEHLKKSGTNDMARIEYLIWIEEETLYPALMKLVRDDDDDDDSE